MRKVGLGSSDAKLMDQSASAPLAPNVTCENATSIPPPDKARPENGPVARQLRARGTAVLGGMSRADLFAGILVGGCANGLAARVIDSVAQQGFGGSLVSTFDTSLVVWIACYFGITFVWRDHPEKIHYRDVIVGSSALCWFQRPSEG
jgi:hypothetical protein